MEQNSTYKISNPLRLFCTSKHNFSSKNSKINPNNKVGQFTINRIEPIDVPKNNSLVVTYWNSGGFRNVNELEQEARGILANSDIICKIETFAETEIVSPCFLEHFEANSTPATRRFQTGRASGGIAVFTNKKTTIHTEVLYTHENFIIIKTQSGGTIFTIIAVYIQPNKTKDSIIRDMENYISLTKEQWPNSNLIVLGDFNAQISNIPDDPELFDSIWKDRKAMDQKLDKRGEALINAMSTYKLRVINGRVKGDEDGNYTYLSSNGNSTIDLCFIEDKWDLSQLTLAFYEYPHTNHCIGKVTVNKTQAIKPKKSIHSN